MTNTAQPDASHDAQKAELQSQIGAVMREIAKAVEIALLWLVYLLSLAILFVARLLPFLLMVASVGAWLVMVFVTAYCVWQLFAVVSPADGWSNMLLGAVAGLFVAVIPLDRTFTREMFGRCAAGAIVGVVLSWGAQYLQGVPDWFWMIRLVPNMLSVGLITMLALNASKNRQEESDGPVAKD